MFMNSVRTRKFYHHSCCEFEPRLWRGLLDTTLCDKVCQWLATGRLFSLGTRVASINKTDHNDITEILLKVVLNSINQTNQSCSCSQNRIIGIMVRVPTISVVNRVFEPRSGQTKILLNWNWLLLCLACSI